MEGTFHYMLMANQALVHKKLLAYLKDTGLTIGQPRCWNICPNTTAPIRPRSPAAATLKRRR